MHNIPNEEENLQKSFSLAIFKSLSFSCWMLTATVFSTRKINYYKCFSWDFKKTRLNQRLHIVSCPVFSCSVMSDTLWPHGVDCQAPLSMGILRARIVEWVTMLSSRGSSQPRDQTQASHVAGGFFAVWAARDRQS